MAIEIQNVGAPGQPSHELASRCQVEEPAGLLAGQRIDRKPAIAFQHLDRAVQLSLRQPDRFVQAFQGTDGTVVAQHDGAGAQQFGQGSQQDRRQLFGTCRIGLYRQHIAVAVDNEAGQVVALRVDQAVMRPGVEPVAQRQGGGQALVEKGRIQLPVWLPVVQPGGDQRMKVETGGAQWPAIGASQCDQRSRRERTRRGIELQFIGKGPGMAGAQTPVLAVLHFNQGQGHGAVIGNPRPSVSYPGG